MEQPIRSYFTCLPNILYLPIIHPSTHHSCMHTSISPFHPSIIRLSIIHLSTLLSPSIHPFTWLSHTHAFIHPPMYPSSQPTKLYRKQPCARAWTGSWSQTRALSSGDQGERTKGEDRHLLNGCHGRSDSMPRRQSTAGDDFWVVGVRYYFPPVGV